jgi:hypothetical protein
MWALLISASLGAVHAVGRDGIDHPGFVAQFVPDHGDVFAGGYPAKGFRAAGPPADARSCPGIVHHLFDLFYRDAMLGDILDIPVWIVLQVPDDRDSDHKNSRENASVSL